ncbi:MAG: hypothetical protein NTZ10_01410 [Candidatus Saganbacteria bacterium]|nr:hypothetical protein [Candidatus Saganbacteria bacterium]
MEGNNIKTVLINLIFCVVIVILGSWAYVVNRDIIGVYIAIGFAFFAVSHLIGIFGREKVTGPVFDIIRMLGFLSVIIALFLSAIYK